MVFSVFSFFIISNCAKPNYQDITPAAGRIENPFNDYDKTSTHLCGLLFTTQNICIQIIWSEPPKENEYQTFELKFYENNKPEKPIDQKYSIFIVFTMPIMGHGAPLTHRIQKISDGIYKVSKIYLIMGGEWNISIQLKDGANVNRSS